MKRLSFSLLLVSLAAVPTYLAAQAASTQKPAAASTAKPAAGRVIEINGTQDMKFSMPTITAKPGEQLTIRFKNVSTLPKAAGGHNFVLLKDTANAATFANDSMMAGLDKDYLPAARKADVLQSTPILGPGETKEVTFKAPAKAASYPYLCSFAGHFAAGMKGTLVVK